MNEITPPDPTPDNGPDLADNAPIIAHGLEGLASLARKTQLPLALIMRLAKQDRLIELFDPAGGGLLDAEVLRERFMPQTPRDVDEWFTKYGDQLEVHAFEIEPGGNEIESGGFAVALVLDVYHDREAAEAARDRVEVELAALLSDPATTDQEKEQP